MRLAPNVGSHSGSQAPPCASHSGETHAKPPLAGGATRVLATVLLPRAPIAVTWRAVAPAGTLGSSL